MKFNQFQICRVVLSLCVASHVYGNPVQSSDVTADPLASTLPSAGPPIVEDIVEDIVIHKYEENETAPNKTGSSEEMTSDSASTNQKASPFEQRIVIHAHEDQEIVPSEDGVPQGSFLRRDFDEVFVDPSGEEYVLKPADDGYVLKPEEDDLDTAATLVFRPYFRYSKKTVRRYPYNTRRTTRPRPRPRPRPFYYY